MEEAVDLRAVVKHIVDGTLDENICRVCLKPFEGSCENIFTTVCKDGVEFCVANTMKNLCQIQFSDTDRCNVCLPCFSMAATAHKFYCLAKCSDEILNFYVDDLEKNALSIQVPEDPTHDTVCITLPEIEPHIGYIDVDQICSSDYCIDLYGWSLDEEHGSSKNQLQNITIKNPIKQVIKEEKKEEDDENIIVYINKGGQPQYYRITDKNILKKLANMNNEQLTQKRNEMQNKNEQIERKTEQKMKIRIEKVQNKTVEKKRKEHRKKRDPMVYRSCSQCPVKYRFTAKLKEHMKIEHNIDLFVCRVCKTLYESELEFNIHMREHTNIMCCHICNAAFKKRTTIIAHLRWHEESKNASKLEGAHICEQCGVVLPDEESLQEHNVEKHCKKYTCYYCGRMYKGEISFEMHIRKHEKHMKPEDRKSNKPPLKERPPAKERNKNWLCTTCGRYFVDERALMWHSMLHTNTKPYKCESCPRAFVSLNRRNQHSRTAHSVPTRRCPLCPALFHLTSMVNTHIKKVHLREHKRRPRASKHQNVSWRTDAVPIQELSVDVQNHLLDYATKKNQLENQSEDWDMTVAVEEI